MPAYTSDVKVTPPIWHACGCDVKAMQTVYTTWTLE